MHSRSNRVNAARPMRGDDSHDVTRRFCGRLSRRRRRSPRIGQPLRTDQAAGCTFAGVKSAQAGAVLVRLIQHTLSCRAKDLANKGHLAAMYNVRDYAAAGGLMAYGTNFAALFRRTADYVHKILKG